MESDVDGGYRRIASGPQSVLGATLFALGSDRRYVEAATGLDFGVDVYRFASDAQTVSIEDAERITEIIREQGRSGPTFWTGYTRRGTMAANELTEKLGSLATVGDRPAPHRGGSPGDLRVDRAPRRCLRVAARQRLPCGAPDPEGSRRPSPGDRHALAGGTDRAPCPPEGHSRDRGPPGVLADGVAR